MTRSSTAMLLNISALILLVACIAFAGQEEKIDFDALPPPVQDTAKQRSEVDFDKLDGSVNGLGT